MNLCNQIKVILLNTIFVNAKLQTIYKGIIDTIIVVVQKKKYKFKTY